MSPLTQAILVLSAAVAAGAVAIGAFELRGIRSVLTTGRIKVVTYKASFSPSTESGLLGSPGGYAIYVYRQQRWALEADLSNPGYEAIPPLMSGAFEGQVVKKQSAVKVHG